MRSSFALAALFILSTVRLAQADEDGEAIAPNAHPDDVHADTYDVTTQKWNHYDPEYLQAETNWGVQLTGSLNALGANPISTFAYTQGNSAVELAGEYQPHFLQKIGVIGIGPQIAVYPVSGSYNGGQITSSGFAIYGLGGQIRYQAKFFEQQLIVPFVSLEASKLQYSFENGPSGSAPLSGYSGGINLLLNRLDPEAGRDFFVNCGVARAYAILAVKNLSGSDANVSVSGNSIYFGFRFEF